MLGNAPLANDDNTDEEEVGESFDEEASVDGGTIRDLGVGKMTKMKGDRKEVDIDDETEDMDTLGDELLSL